MDVFLDTEFIRVSERIDLISIGLCDETGNSWYAEVSPLPLIHRSNTFVLEVVCPLLSQNGHALQITKTVTGRANDLGRSAAEWLSHFNTISLIFDYPGDWELLSRILPQPTIQNIHPCLIDPTGNDVGHQAYQTFFQNPAVFRHHALYDALALRAAYQATTEKYSKIFPE